MAGLDHEYDEFLVLDIADDAVVADPVALVSAQQIPLKWFSEASGVVVSGKTLFQKRHNALGIFLPAYRS